MRTWHWLVIIPVVLVVTWAGLRLYWKAQVRREIAAIKAGGWPLTLAEVGGWYTIPEGVENAADLYLEASSQLGQGDAAPHGGVSAIADGIIPGVGEPFDANDAVRIVQYLADNRASLDLLHKAASVEHCRYPGSPWQGLPDLEVAMRSLVLEACWNAYQGQAEPATVALESAWALANSVDGIPGSLPYSRASSLRSEVAGALQWVLTRASLPDECLQRLYTRVAVVTTPSLAAMLVETRARLIEYYHKTDSLRSAKGADAMRPMHPDLLGPYFLFGLADRDLARTLQLNRLVIELASRPLDERPCLRDLDRSLPAVPGLCPLASSYRLNFKMWLVSQDSAATSLIRVTQAGLAVERFRLAEGHLPSGLGELVPRFLDAVPRDPFDGGSLRYEKKDRGYVVYSSGGDQIDDRSTREREDRFAVLR